MLWWYRAIWESVVGTAPAGRVPVLLCMAGVPSTLATAVAEASTEDGVVEVVCFVEVVEVVFFEVVEVVFLEVVEVVFLEVVDVVFLDVLDVVFLLEDELEVVFLLDELEVLVDVVNLATGVVIDVEMDTAAVAVTAAAKVSVAASAEIAKIAGMGEEVKREYVCGSNITICEVAKAYCKLAKVNRPRRWWRSSTSKGRCNTGCVRVAQCLSTNLQKMTEMTAFMIGTVTMPARLNSTSSQHFESSNMDTVISSTEQRKYNVHWRFADASTDLTADPHKLHRCFGTRGLEEAGSATMEDLVGLNHPDDVYAHFLVPTTNSEHVWYSSRGCCTSPSLKQLMAKGAEFGFAAVARYFRWRQRGLPLSVNRANALIYLLLIRDLSVWGLTLTSLLHIRPWPGGNPDPTCSRFHHQPTSCTHLETMSAFIESAIVRRSCSVANGNNTRTMAHVDYSTSFDDVVDAAGEVHQLDEVTVHILYIHEM
nr:hypothetical protein CFP56_65854 [Quercus suber]